jgi:hypothetical protein
MWEGCSLQDPSARLEGRWAHPCAHVALGLPGWGLGTPSAHVALGLLPVGWALPRVDKDSMFMGPKILNIIICSRNIIIIIINIINKIINKFERKYFYLYYKFLWHFL